jgi:DNA-binding NarL/FixJ family response regulator
MPLVDRMDARRAAIRILIVDDRSLFADALAAALAQQGLEVAALVASGDEAVSVAQAELADAVVLDMSLPGEDAISIGERILAASPQTKLLGLVGTSDDGVREALDSGFHGILTKDSTIPDLTAAIMAITRAHTIIPSASVRSVIGTIEPDIVKPSVARKLTDREREILSLLVKGATSSLIAKKLYLSPHTVRTHIQNILTKLDVHSRLEAVALATRHASARRLQARSRTAADGGGGS